MWRTPAALLLLATVSLGLPAARASATPVHIYFAGEVTYVRSGAVEGPFTSVGNPVTGSLDFDTDWLTAPPLSSSYQLTPPGVLGLSGPGYSNYWQFINVSIFDVTPGSSSFPDTWSTGGTPVSFQYTFTVRLSDDTQTAVPGPGYFTPPSLAGWSRGEVFLSSTGPGPPVTVSTITLSSWIGIVPEPSGLELLALAALGVLGARRAVAR